MCHSWCLTNKRKEIKGVMLLGQSEAASLLCAVTLYAVLNLQKWRAYRGKNILIFSSHKGINKNDDDEGENESLINWRVWMSESAHVHVAYRLKNSHLFFIKTLSQTHKLPTYTLTLIQYAPTATSPSSLSFVGTVDLEYGCVFTSG